MPYRNLPFMPGCYYHVYNRGNNKRPIFFSTKDYQRFLDKLKEYKEKFDLTLIAYSFMPNHFHLELRQNRDTPLSVFVQAMLNSHAKYVSLKYEMVGHVFQGPFKAKLIADESSLLQLSRYIHLNCIKDEIFKLSVPLNKSRKIRQRLVEDLRLFPWSSYREYLERKNPSLVNKEVLLAYFKNAQGYQKFVEAPVSRFDTEELQNLETFPDTRERSNHA